MARTLRAPPSSPRNGNLVRCGRIGAEGKFKGPGFFRRIGGGVGVQQVRASEVRRAENGPGEIGGHKCGIIQLGLGKIATDALRVIEVGIGQMGRIKGSAKGTYPGYFLPGLIGFG